MQTSLLSLLLSLPPCLFLSLSALSLLHLSFSLIQFACSARLSASPLLVHNVPQFIMCTQQQPLCNSCVREGDREKEREGGGEYEAAC